MTRIPETAPISNLNTKQAEILAQMDKGPVLLLSRSTPVGVLVSIDEWNAAADQLDKLTFLQEFVHKKRQIAGGPAVTLDEVVRSAEPNAEVLA